MQKLAIGLLLAAGLLLGQAGQTFKVKEQVAAQNGKLKMVDAVLSLDGQGVRVNEKVFTKESAKVLTYTYAKSPRWKSGVGLLPVLGPFAIPFFFMKGKQHWLTIQSDDQFAVLKLEKGNYRQITAAVEVATGLQAERPEER